MALRPQFSLLHSEFNDFLFAAVDDGTGGRELTVLSALTRLGVDPWVEAARLSRLPRDGAARALAAVLAALPDGEWAAADGRAIAARLVNRLPRRAADPDPAPHGARGRDAGATAKAIPALWLICAILAGAMLLAMLTVHARDRAAPATSAAQSGPRPAPLR